jgi:hypothetical protein
MGINTGLGTFEHLRAHTRVDGGFQKENREKTTILPSTHDRSMKVPWSGRRESNPRH